jgi:hypothetical protein
MALSVLVLLGALGMAPGLSFARATAKTSPAFKLGLYFVRTSPAPDGASTTGERVSLGETWRLARSPARDCGDPQGGAKEVYCLSAQDIDSGLDSTTGMPTNCENSVGEPESGPSWNPVLVLPASGRLSVSELFRADGQPSWRIHATIHISHSGSFTGSLEQTVYVSTTGAPFPGCSSGELTLKGKLES